MNPPANGSGNSSNGAYVFRLYLAGGAPNSVRALANLDAICRNLQGRNRRRKNRRGA